MKVPIPRRLLSCILPCALFVLPLQMPGAAAAQRRGSTETAAKGSGRVHPPWIRNSGSAHAKGVIVFVHGVLGDARTTWSSGNSYWPELLTHDRTFDGQDIYVYGYPSPKLSRSFSIDEVADNLRLVLSDDGILRYTEITFVCHSMGGLVTRAFLLKYRAVAPKIRLVYFFATPTTGSPYAALMAAVSKNPQFGQMYPMSDPDSYLGPLQSSWMAANFGFKSYCAYETQKLLGQIVVERESATNLCTHLDPIDADHITIVKPADAASTAYRALRAAFEETANVHGQAVPNQRATPAGQDPRKSSTPTSPPPKEQPPVVVSAPNGIAIAGGTVTNPTVNNYGTPKPAPRHLSDTQRSGMLPFLLKFPGAKIDIEQYGQNDEADQYAREFADFFRDQAHWDVGGPRGYSSVYAWSGPTPVGIQICIGQKDEILYNRAVALAEALSAASINFGNTINYNYPDAKPGEIKLIIGKAPE